MKITLGEERLVAAGPRPEDSAWGYFQFPRLFRTQRGEIAVSFHNGDDVWSEIGDESKLWFLSRDEGQSWQAQDPSLQEQCGLLLPNGDRLTATERIGIDVSQLEAPLRIGPATIPTDRVEKSDDPGRLPYPRGLLTDIWGQQVRCYLYEDLPDGLIPGGKCWELLRKSAAPDAMVQREWAPLRWPNMAVNVSFSREKDRATLLPPYPLGKLKVAPDGVLWAPTYQSLGSLHPKNGAYSLYCGVFLLASEDNGHHWELRSWISYTPDNQEYENAFISSGYCEPDVEFMPDGSMLVLMRTAGVFLGDREWAPSYLSRSTDRGYSWSKPVRFDDIGVLPRMCRLGEEVTLAIYGRPGIYLRATRDPSGLCWEQPVEVMTSSDRSGLMNQPPRRPNFHQWAGSCCNNDLLPLDEHRAMIVYSDFYHRCSDGVRRKSILTRVVTVE